MTLRARQFRDAVARTRNDMPTPPQWVGLSVVRDDWVHQTDADDNRAPPLGLAFAAAMSS